MAALQEGNKDERYDRAVFLYAFCTRSRQRRARPVQIRMDLGQTSPHRLYSSEKHAHEKARKRAGVLRWRDHPPESIQAPNALLPARVGPKSPRPYRQLQ